MLILFKRIRMLFSFLKKFIIILKTFSSYKIILLMILRGFNNEISRLFFLKLLF